MKVCDTSHLALLLDSCLDDIREEGLSIVVKVEHLPEKDDSLFVRVSMTCSQLDVNIRELLEEWDDSIVMELGGRISECFLNLKETIWQSSQKSS